MFGYNPVQCVAMVGFAIITFACIMFIAYRSRNKGE